MKTLVRTLLCVFLFLAILKTQNVSAGTITSANDGDILRGMVAKYMDTHEEAYNEWYARTYPKYVLDKDSYDILCRIVEAEATGGNLEQKENVASCILVRYDSKSWPNTIEGVVFQRVGGSYQFSPIFDGRYFTVTISDSTIKAVDYVLQHGALHDCDFFCTLKSWESPKSWHRKNLNYIFYDGAHVYSKQ